MADVAEGSAEQFDRIEGFTASVSDSNELKLVRSINNDFQIHQGLFTKKSNKWFDAVRG